MSVEVVVPPGVNVIAGLQFISSDLVRQNSDHRSFAVETAGSGVALCFYNRKLKLMERGASLCLFSKIYISVCFHQAINACLTFPTGHVSY
nr:hypothetical protein Itr_chr05CG01850 [Ipomoea trifida]